jgi:hypothetical protein
LASGRISTGLVAASAWRALARASSDQASLPPFGSRLRTSVLALAALAAGPAGAEAVGAVCLISTGALEITGFATATAPPSGGVMRSCWPTRIRLRFSRLFHAATSL